MVEEKGHENLAIVVSRFLRSSCRRRDEEMFHTNFTDLLRGVSHLVRHPINRMKCRIFPVYTGSSAELYIEPMLSCTGDFDIMYHYNNELAVPSGQPVPTQLPEEYGNRVRVFEIIGSISPGYVHLVLSCVLLKVGSQNAYVIDYVSSSNTFLNHSLYANDEDLTEVICHGPARRHSQVSEELFRTLATDIVPCMHCLHWPPQAASWPKRQRNYGWPNQAALDDIVKAGCDVVGVAHPACKAEEWMRNHQWRLSFSRAEVSLLNSWTLKHQIVYHMLRTLLKTERLTESSGTPGTDSFSNYHIKTMMMWAAEINPHNAWTEGPNFVNICVKIIHFLGEWLEKWHGQHYFISRVHFSDYFNTSSIHTVLAISRTTTEDSLSQWFLDHYIRRCAELCPDNVLLSFAEELTNKNLRDAVVTILKWRDHIADTVLIEQKISTMLNSFLCTKNYVGLPDATSVMSGEINQLFESMVDMNHSKCQKFVRACFESAIPYFMLKRLDSKRIDEERKTDFLNFISYVTSFFRYCGSQIYGQKLTMPHFPITSSPKGSVETVKMATTLMKLTAVERRKCTTSELILMAQSKGYLARALRCRDSHYDSICCLANVYSAILHYITGRFQRAIDHCMLVTKSQDHSPCTSSFVQGHILPKIADDMDVVLGLVVLYQHLRTTASITQTQSHDPRIFTPEMFAHCFLIKNLLVAKCRLAPRTVMKSTAKATKKCVFEQLVTLRNGLLGCESLLISDLMLCKLSKNHSHSRSNNSTLCVHDFGETDGVEILATHSIEDLLKSSRRAAALYRSIAANTIGDFLAISLYRCGLYEQCMELCQRNIQEIDAEKPIPRLSTTYYEFIQLMYDDIVSPCGLAVLVNKPEWRPKLDAIVTVSQLILSLYLLIRSQVKGLHDQQTVVITMIGILERLLGAERLTSTASFMDELMLKLSSRQAMALIEYSLQDSSEENREQWS